MSAPRLLLCAPASGGGKTTVTCAILQALMDRNLNPVAFKCGPDYIDPMFHSEIIWTCFSWGRTKPGTCWRRTAPAAAWPSLKGSWATTTASP